MSCLLLCTWTTHSPIDLFWSVREKHGKRKGEGEGGKDGKGEGLIIEGLVSYTACFRAEILGKTSDSMTIEHSKNWVNREKQQVKRSKARCCLIPSNRSPKERSLSKLSLGNASSKGREIKEPTIASKIRYCWRDYG